MKLQIIVFDRSILVLAYYLNWTRSAFQLLAASTSVSDSRIFKQT